jgi:sphingomyelin phosphodiesterase acid-like 3
LSRLIGVLALAILFVTVATPAAARSQPPWLVISDLHYSPFIGGSAPSHYGYDTNDALFDSLLAQLKRTDPNAPVVIVAGDFLAHGFPPARAAATMAYVARRFDRAFPHAQFVITLGNNDSDCGDYEATLDGPFLRAVASAWQPLVDRHGAAPNFSRTFSHDGGYVATLPVPNLRAVSVNDVYDTVRYRDRCGTGNPAATSLGDLDRTLQSGSPHERTWLITHVPPGIDAYSTAHLGHHLFVVPFMRPSARDQFLRAIGASGDRVSLVIAGHIHHFSFRLSDAGRPAHDVPILIAPSVSPIFGNSPGYLTLDVAANGDVENVTETAYLEGRWQRIGDLASEGVARFTAPELAVYEARLERGGGAAADRFVRLYMGGAPPEISRKDYRVYWCAATALGETDEQRCTSSGGFWVFTRRALLVGGAIALGASCMATSIVIAVIRRRRAAATEKRRA